MVDRLSRDSSRVPRARILIASQPIFVTFQVWHGCLFGQWLFSKSIGDAGCLAIVRYLEVDSTRLSSRTLTGDDRSKLTMSSIGTTESICYCTEDILIYLIELDDDKVTVVY